MVVSFNVQYCDINLKRESLNLKRRGEERRGEDGKQTVSKVCIIQIRMK
jgi:hypothetical protein